MRAIRLAIEAADALHHRHSDHMEVVVGPLSPPANPALVARLVSCAKLAKARQAQTAPVYQASGEWSGILGSSFKIGEALTAMFRDESTSIGSSYSSRGLNGNSPKAWLKRAFIRRDVALDLKAWRSITQSDIGELIAPDVGSPWGVKVDGALIYPGSCRAHYFAVQVDKLLNNIGTQGCVVEIGGGYGEFAYRLLKRRPGVKYICFDLPEILIRAAYFLMTAMPDKRVLLYDEATRPLGEMIDSYDIILMPNFKIVDMPALSADILISTRSFSEMGREAVSDYMQHTRRIVKTYFLHENSSTPAVHHGYTEIPAHEFPIPEEFRNVYVHKSPWVIGDGAHGRYVECLYERH